MKARRRITVSSLGLGPYRTFGGQPVPHGADAVDAMKKHWQQWLDVVLPDKPDLIVVPEACALLSGEIFLRPEKMSGW